MYTIAAISLSAAPLYVYSAYLFNNYGYINAWWLASVVDHMYVMHMFKQALRQISLLILYGTRFAKTDTIRYFIFQKISF